MYRKPRDAVPELSTYKNHHAHIKARVHFKTRTPKKVDKRFHQSCRIRCEWENKFQRRCRTPWFGHNRSRNLSRGVKTDAIVRAGPERLHRSFHLFRIDLPRLIRVKEVKRLLDLLDLILLQPGSFVPKNPAWHFAQEPIFSCSRFFVKTETSVILHLLCLNAA